MTIFDQSLTLSATACNCFVTTSIVWSASRCCIQGQYSYCSVLDQNKCLTSRLSPQHKMTPNPPSSAALAFFATNCIENTRLALYCTPPRHRGDSQDQRRNKRKTNLGFLLQQCPAFAVPENRPRNVAVEQLADAYLTGKGAIGLVKAILRSDFKAGLEVLAGEQEIQCRRRDDDLCILKSVNPGQCKEAIRGSVSGEGFVAATLRRIAIRKWGQWQTETRV